uniref:Cell cycle exit and neuronal differentiation 1 n=1 Tax=Pan troglodytes TaxID=9598 RepID=K7CAV6_PANTR
MDPVCGPPTSGGWVILGPQGWSECRWGCRDGLGLGPALVGTLKGVVAPLAPFLLFAYPPGSAWALCIPPGVCLGQCSGTDLGWALTSAEPQCHLPTPPKPSWVGRRSPEACVWRGSCPRVALPSLCSRGAPMPAGRQGCRGPLTAVPALPR